MTMVDVSEKPEISRRAVATGTIKLKPETIRLMKKKQIAKGDPSQVAKVAGILAAKKTSELVALCHPLPLTSIEVDVKIEGRSTVRVTSSVKAKAQTGVEMEALTATAVALLTVWDMVKQYEKDSRGQYPSTAIENIHVLEKIKKDK
jgi:cyclic pyranopterin phosphate synthase